ncbi:MAG TPA: DUF58 domain-containing protein [Thermoplasmata archaeon]|nr:DUF58 domain-containing protein [Thermoplasmata archaeon]
MTGPPSAPRPLRWRTRTFLLLGGGLVAAVAAVLARQPALLFLGLPLLLAPLAAVLAGPPRDPRATLEWRVDGSGPEVDVVGRIELAPPTRPTEVEVRFDRPTALTERAPPRIERDPTSISFSLSWHTDEPVIAPVAPPHVVWADPLGLVEREVALEAPSLAIERYPPELLRLGTVRLERTILLPGETRSHRIGSSGEFFGIRDATPSEPPRRINWPASARAGRLLANEFELDRTGDVLLLLDARPSPLGRAIDERLLSIATAAAYGVADSFLREKARVGLGVFGEFLDVVPLAGGRTQRLRLRRALLATHLTSSPGPPERCAIAVRRQFPPGVTTIVFTTLGDETSDHLLTHLRWRGFPTLVVSPSPLPLQEAARTLSEEEERLVARLARLVRRDRLARVWEHAPVVDWEEYWSLGGLVDLLRRPGRWGRRA